jgi:hypothetical protein
MIEELQIALDIKALKAKYNLSRPGRKKRLTPRQ